VDAYAITATRVWLSRHTRSKRVRRFAGLNAIGAIGLSLGGNTAYHFIAASPTYQLIHAGQEALDWRLVVLVSAVPPIAIGLISHLAVLRSRDAEYADAERHAVADRSGDDSQQAGPAGSPDHGRQAVHTAARDTNLDQVVSHEPDQHPAVEGRTTGQHRVQAPRPGTQRGRRASRMKPPVRTAEDSARDQRAVTAYLGSVAAGEPLSERKLAAQFDITSRRWARKIMATAKTQSAGTDGRQSGEQALPMADAAAR
jgi:hypothetical protein